MKISDILEARYYGRHTRQDVIKQYGKAIDKGKFKHTPRHSYSDQNVFLRSIETTGRYLWGDIFVKDATGPEEDVNNEIEQYLNKMKVPFDEVYDLEQHSDGNGLLSSWEATTVLELDNYRDDNQLTEARYAGRYKTSDVARQYERVARIEDDGSVGMLDTNVPTTGNKRTRINQPPDNIVKGYLYIYARTIEEMHRKIADFMKDNNIPYDDVDEIEDDAEWYNAVVTYKGES